jgi:PAS domain-containing protein
VSYHMVPCVPALVVAMAAPAAPFLEELKLDIPTKRIFSWADPILAAATRLTCLEINWFRFEGPPPMIVAGRAAILAFRNGLRIEAAFPSADYFDALLALLRSLSAAATPGVGVEPPVLVRLEPLWLTPRMHLEQAAYVHELTSVFGRHLTRLAVRAVTPQDRDELRDPETHAEARAAVARLLENRALPALRELVIDWRWSAFGVPLDLAAVHAPPPGLTFLSVRIGYGTDILLSPAIRAGLASLALQCPANFFEPPQCLRGAGGSFGRLTRLVYGSSDAGDGIINLAPWGQPEFSVPTLVEMDVVGPCFTLNELGRWDGGSWCEGFLAALPRLARLVLWAINETRPFRALADGSTDAAAVQNIQNTITARLPQAARASGRRLDVAVHQEVDDYAARMARFGWRVKTHLLYSFQLAFEARPPR